MSPLSTSSCRAVSGAQEREPLGREGVLSGDRAEPGDRDRACRKD